jgi:hypothetical protein
MIIEYLLLGICFLNLLAVSWVVKQLQEKDFGDTLPIIRLLTETLYVEIYTRKKDLLETRTEVYENLVKSFDNKKIKQAYKITDDGLRVFYYSIMKIVEDELRERGFIKR